MLIPWQLRGRVAQEGITQLIAKFGILKWRKRCRQLVANYAVLEIETIFVPRFHNVYGKLHRTTV